MFVGSPEEYISSESMYHLFPVLPAPFCISEAIANFTAVTAPSTCSGVMAAPCPQPGEVNADHGIVTTDHEDVGVYTYLHCEPSVIALLFGIMRKETVVVPVPLFPFMAILRPSPLLMRSTGVPAPLSSALTAMDCHESPTIFADMRPA